MLDHCVKSDLDEAYKILSHLWKQGYSPEDIITIIFRVCKTHNMAEYLKLEYLKVGPIIIYNYIFQRCNYITISLLLD